MAPDIVAYLRKTIVWLDNGEPFDATTLRLLVARYRVKIASDPVLATKLANDLDQLSSDDKHSHPDPPTVPSPVVPGEEAKVSRPRSGPAPRGPRRGGQ